MKKLLTFLVICVLASPIFVLAVAPGTIPGPSDYGIDTGGLPSDTGGLLNVLGSVVKWVYMVFFIVAVLFIIFAAFDYLTGVDSPEKIKIAHKKLIYAAIAVVVALLAVSFQLIIGSFLKESDGGGSGAPSEDSQPHYWIPSPDYPGGPVST